MSFGSEPRVSPGVRRIASVVFAVLWLLVLVAGLAELFLVGYAERRVTRAIERDGTGVSVRIKARPAAKLLVGQADAVVVRVEALRSGRPGSGGASLGDLLAGTDAACRIDARVDTLSSNRVTLRDVRLTKRGDRLTGSATVTRRGVEAALPSSLALSARPGSRAFRLDAKASLFGRRVNASATVTTKRGRLVIAPQVRGITVLSLALFDDARVSVDRVSATAVPGGYRFTAAGHLT